MIGVAANLREEAVVREFFELFKTPWEFCQSRRQYDVVLCAGQVNLDAHAARLVLIFCGQTLPFDTVQGTQVLAQGSEGCAFDHDGLHIPIYGDYVTFQTEVSPGVEPSEGMLVRYKSNGKNVVRIGFDLFAEVRTLLTRGQPSVNAAIPTLELHIALLRALIVGSGVCLVEIPPVPDGYRFIACLTHDVDHPLMRQHKLDRTTLGFIYRATYGSLVKLLRGQLSLADLLTNWLAVLKLPLVHLGMAKDPWSEFDRYIVLEEGAPSCFFVIPFAGRPGRNLDGPAVSARAARYGAVDIKEQVHKVASGRCEVGLHGIDAWLDPSAARNEIDEIRALTGQHEIGVRMHWLYFNEQSPQVLESAGATYDSTIGYNETIGYRAGTSQVFKPLQVSNLLELPLHVMDTALFFPSHLNLSIAEARERIIRIVEEVIQFGGCVTLNWHDRSISPERLWEKVYVDILGELRNGGAWFATPAHAVSWFRKRRAATFESVHWHPSTLRADILSVMDDDLPGLQLRVHDRNDSYQDVGISATAQQSDANVTVGLRPHSL